MQAQESPGHTVSISAAASSVFPCASITMQHQITSQQHQEFASKFAPQLTRLYVCLLLWAMLLAGSSLYFKDVFFVADSLPSWPAGIQQSSLHVPAHQIIPGVPGRALPAGSGRGESPFLDEDSY